MWLSEARKIQYRSSSAINLAAYASASTEIRLAHFRAVPEFVGPAGRDHAALR
jgi:hypothetical protein